MVPYIGSMAVEKRKWLDEESFRDGVALCQTIPGATAMQVSAYVGFKVRGVGGAAASFIGFGLPAFLLMIGLSAFYARSYTLSPVIAVFNGLQAIIVAIVANAAVSFGKSSLKGLRDGMVAMIAVVMFAFRVSPILVIILAALLGLVLYKKNTPSNLQVSSQRNSRSTKALWIIASMIVMIDFQKQETPVGPPMEMRIAREGLIRQMESNGFRLVQEHKFLPYQYFLIFGLK